MSLYGAIEAGGTKFVCAVGDAKGNIQERISIPTTTPEETMPEVIAFFKKFSVDAIGIGSFGPIDVDKNNATYGNITTTPKLAWKDFPLLKTIEDEFSVPTGFNTDVNVAALGEAKLGAAKGVDNCLYITIGTGIGAGAYINGELLQGLTHPEMGHILVRRHPKDSYKGRCPYHADCLEGLAAGPAIEERWGEKAFHLSDKEEVWEMEGYYIAQALMQYILILSPKKIILGGGVMNQEHVLTYVYRYLGELLNGYVSYPEVQDKMNEYIVRPGLGDNAGITGGLLLAEKVFHER
ncbi:fructokinase [Niallia circulans]|jgi:fructokinase|uniref:fructokinase n=1 Tax=Niallia circulans TaxID=1397 RepID=A0A0J1I9N6_NIACI|nr:ROK family protein [Niallia circulans]KLV22686.1 fructokinase [Niallia circulans]MCM2983151.1 ROK family protein [Niallia circulans]MDR4318312.1 ROK family protein [Niallia circulans]MED3840452.1 ROK family protein [Niallia circulans]MED4243213.1 ROK family protein [Niallia circulans]